MSEELRFDLRVKEQPVVLTDKNGDVKRYSLREMTGANRDKFLDSMSERISYSQDGTTSIQNFDGFQASLISKCLFDGNNDLVSVDEIQRLPSSVVSSLFKEAQRMNGLADNNVVEKAKNA
jgi:hypothetical protein